MIHISITLYQHSYMRFRPILYFLVHILSSFVTFPASPPLTQRFRSITDLLPLGAIVADIGADHGIVSASIVGIADRVYAVEKSQIAAKNGVISLVEKLQLQDKVKVLLGDGLVPLVHAGVEHIDTVVIAGMGAKSMLKILNEGKEASVDKLGNTYDISACL